MTDNEIIKALEVCCAGACTEVCPQYSYKYHDCMEQLMKDTIDLIKQQQERMDRIVEQLDEYIAQKCELSSVEYHQNIAFEKAIDIVKGVKNE